MCDCSLLYRVFCLFCFINNIHAKRCVYSVIVITVVTWLVPRETAGVSAHVLRAPCNHAPVCCVTLVKATYVGCMHVSHFWQNDLELLCATAVTRGWNGYRNKSQHTKLTLEKQISPAAPAGTQTRDLSITCLALTAELSPIPAVIN